MIVQYFDVIHCKTQEQVTAVINKLHSEQGLTWMHDDENPLIENPADFEIEQKFFKNINEEEKSIIEEKLIETYKRKGINFDDETLYKENDRDKINIKKWCARNHYVPEKKRSYTQILVYDFELCKNDGEDSGAGYKENSDGFLELDEEEMPFR